MEEQKPLESTEVQNLNPASGNTVLNQSDNSQPQPANSPNKISFPLFFILAGIFFHFLPLFLFFTVGDIGFLTISDQGAGFGPIIIFFFFFIIILPLVLFFAFVFRLIIKQRGVVTSDVFAFAFPILYFILFMSMSVFYNEKDVGELFRFPVDYLAIFSLIFAFTYNLVLRNGTPLWLEGVTLWWGRKRKYFFILFLILVCASLSYNFFFYNKKANERKINTNMTCNGIQKV